MAVLALAWAAPARSSDWNRTDTAVEAAVLASVACDWMQTVNFTQRHTFYESNPVLGATPSAARVHAYFAAVAAAHAAAAYVLPRPWRSVWQVAWFGIETGYVVHNVRAGVAISF
jgi:hypothetical protein